MSFQHPHLISTPFLLYFITDPRPSLETSDAPFIPHNTYLENERIDTTPKPTAKKSQHSLALSLPTYCTTASTLPSIMKSQSDSPYPTYHRMARCLQEIYKEEI